MADPRTFVLIGNFEDNITPALTSINNTINTFKRNMASMATKRGGGYNDVTQSVGKLVSAQKHLKEAIEGVGAAAKSATQDLKDYKNVMGKVSSAHYHIQRSGTAAGKAQSKFWEGANNDLNAYRRNMEALQRQTRINPYRALTPPGGARRGGRGGTTLPMMAAPGGGGPPRGGGGGGGGGGYNFHMGAFSFGMELGQGLAQPISSAIFSGFQMGVGLMAKTMEYVQSSFAERVQDQMTDLQTAGGYYAIAQRQKDPMFTSLQSAIRFTQETNLVMSRLASDLPGSTEDYVKVSKRIGDSVMRLVDQNEKGSIAYAQQLITKGGLQEQYKNISLEGPEAREGAISVILGELTKKTVLAGFGGSSGRGGAAGPYGLPALMERLITQPGTSMASLNKYASVFGDPKIMAGLERAEEKLQKAGSNMLERAKVVNEFLDEVVPPEMIAAMRKSMAGMMEAFRSAFFDPEMGLFGFGRKLGDEANKADKLLQPMTNEFGQFVKEEIENGKKIYTVVKTAGQASQVSMGIFEMFADIVSNYGAIIKPIVDNLYLLWDPLEGLGMVLKDVRIISTQLLDLFRTYDTALKQEVDKLEKEGKKELAKQLGITRSLRSSLLTIFDIFTDLGAFSEEDFKTYRAMIIDPTKGIKDLANLVKTAVTTFFDSDAGFNAGKFVGEMLREVVISLSEFTGFISQLGTTQLVKGFMSGFGEEGVKAVEKIFRDIYTLLIDAAKAIIPRIPWQVYAIAALGVVLPAAISGLAMAFAQGITEMLRKMGEMALGKIAQKGGAVQVATDFIESLDDAIPGVRPVGGPGGGAGAAAAQARLAQQIGQGTYDPVTGKRVMPLGAEVEAAAPPPKTTLKGHFKNFLKGAVGADESLLGRPLVDLVKNIRASLSGLVGKLAKLKPMFSSFGMFIDVLADSLGMLIEAIPGVKQLGTFIEDWMDLGFKGAAGNAAKGFKNFFAKGKGGLASLFGKGKGLLGGLLGGAKGGGLGALFGKAGGGIKGLFGKGMKGLGKFGGIATAGVGIVEALMSLLSGDSLGTALGKGAGPVLGTIIGTALLGPLGGIIGGMIGGMKPVTDALTGIFEGLLWGFGQLSESLGPAVEAVGGVFSTLFEIVKGMIPGMNSVSDSISTMDFLFIATKLALFPFISALNGAVVAVLLLRVALLEFDKWVNNTFQWGDRQGRIQSEIDNTWSQIGKVSEIQAKVNADVLKKLSKPEDRKVGTKATLGGKEVTWDGKEWKPTGKPGAPSAPKPTPKPPAAASPYKVGYLTKNGVKGWQGTDGTWTPLQQNTPPTARTTQTMSPMNQAAANFFGGAWKALTTTPSQAGAKPDPYGPSAPKPPPASKEVSETAQNTSNINQKATEQITQATQTKDAAKKTEKNTATSVTTLGNIKAGVIAISNKVGGLQTAILGDLNNIQAGVAKISSLLSSGSLKVKAEGMNGGGPLGTAKGDLGRASNLAAQHGLTMTSWFRKGDKGYHGLGRAMDFSNGVSTPQQMEFAQAMVNQYGTSLKELIYTPLGFGIKDGTRVPLSYWGAATNAGHYDHVHVAFANGPEDGRMFTNQKAAGGWENSMVPGSVKVASITGNSGEQLGSSTFGDINITVNAGSVSDPDDLAVILAQKFGDAVAELQARALFSV